MQALMAQCDDDGMLVPLAAFGPGDVVEIVDGPFATLAGRIGALDQDGRVWVLMAIPGRETRVLATTTQLGRIR